MAGLPVIRSYSTVDVDEVGDVDGAETVGGVTDVDAGVVDVDRANPQHVVVHAVALPAEVDRLSVLGPRDDRRSRRRLHRADETQVHARS